MSRMKRTLTRPLLGCALEVPWVSTSTYELHEDRVHTKGIRKQYCQRFQELRTIREHMKEVPDEAAR